MMTKICTKCNKTKELVNFTKDRQKKDGKCSSCKDCRRDVTSIYKSKNVEKLRSDRKAYKDSLRNDYYTIYLIPLENYVGVSTSPVRRIREHKRLGKDITGWTEIARVRSKKLSIDIERMLHDDYGYDGSNNTHKYGNQYNKKI